MSKFIIKEIIDNEYPYYYAGNGNWINKIENAKVYSNKNILTKITPFEGDLEIIEVE